MFGKLFGAKTASPATFILAQLNDRAQPIDRGEIYEDPLAAILEKHHAGSITGGGTMLAENGEIDFCDIEIEVREPAAEYISLIKRALEELGAPKGSKLTVQPEGEELRFGVNEGLAVYINGTDLPDEVYAECDVNSIYDEFHRLLGADGKVHSHWQGPTETALYIYGPSFETMKSRIAGFLASYPLCQGARVVQIA
jgi:hypothetical protein